MKVDKSRTKLCACLQADNCEFLFGDWEAHLRMCEIVEKLSSDVYMIDGVEYDLILTEGRFVFLGYYHEEEE